MAIVIVKLGQSATEFEVSYPIGRAVETLMHHIKGIKSHRIDDLDEVRKRNGKTDKRNIAPEVSDTVRYEQDAGVPC